MVHCCAQVIAEVGSNYTARQIERMLLNLGQTLPVRALLVPYANCSAADSHSPG